jgi:hypothetical protein
MIARYRTQRGADNYARDIERHWSKVTAQAKQHPYDFGWGVLVTIKASGQEAWAAKRPRNYSR